MKLIKIELKFCYHRLEVLGYYDKGKFLQDFDGSLVEVGQAEYAGHQTAIKSFTVHSHKKN